MLNNQCKTNLTFVITIVLLLTSYNCIAQNDYQFIPPNSIYTREFKANNRYNKEIINYIKKSQPIYINGSDINIDEAYIENKVRDYNLEFSLTINYYVINYIKAYALKERINYSNSIYNYYSSSITENISKNNLPDVFKYIPLVCSNFNPLSNNKKGGIGYWQLNYVPGIKYGLIINKDIDERRDFEKSTIAASKYLNHIYTIYNDWQLTLAAYSCGINTVNKALLRTKGTTFWDIYPILPPETRDLVPAFTAMVYCINEAGNDNYLLTQYKIENDTVYIDRKLKFKAIETVIKTKSKKLVFLNPTLNAEVFPSDFMAIFPKGDCDKFTELEDSIYFYQDSVLLKPKPKTPSVVLPKDGEPFIYTVKSGDVLGVIADRFNVRVSQLQDWNNINGTRIDIGQKLTIYGKKKSKTSCPTVMDTFPPKEEKKSLTPTVKPQTGSNHTTYTVKSGDSLWLIAKKFSGVSAQNIMDYNGIGENLTVGQVLKIPKN